MKFIYFLRADGLDRIKIGCSIDPQLRLDTVQKWSPVELTLASVAPGDQRTENFLHNIFAASRMAGEWFSTSPLLEQLVAEVRAIGVLPSWARAPLRWHIKVVDDRGLKISDAHRRRWAAMSPEKRKAHGDLIKCAHAVRQLSTSHAPRVAR